VDGHPIPLGGGLADCLKLEDYMDKGIPRGNMVKPHAEVKLIANQQANAVSGMELYMVTLEPYLFTFWFLKPPPCSDLLIRKKTFQRVVLGINRSKKSIRVAGTWKRN